MAKRRLQDSSRASWLATKSPNSIGRILVQMPPGERKSGMPHSVEIPAPVNGTTVSAPSTRSRKCRMAVSRSDAIIAILSLSWPDTGTEFDQANGNEVTMRFLHTMLRVRNLDAALNFYCNLLGLEEVRRRTDEKNKYTLVFLAAPEDAPAAKAALAAGRR